MLREMFEEILSNECRIKEGNILICEARNRVREKKYLNHPTRGVQQNYLLEMDQETAYEICKKKLSLRIINQLAAELLNSLVFLFIIKKYIRRTLWIKVTWATGTTLG